MSRDKEWFELPQPAAVSRLVEIRNELRAKNLHDTEDPPLPQDPGSVPAEAKGSRTSNGEFNDLRCPVMGSSGTRFGRNVPLSETFPDTANLMTPSPRTVSQELFTREKFQPVTILNVMAAAWIQFQTHDWFLHRQGTMDSAHEIPLTDGDPWPERPMRLPKTPVDPQKRPDPKRPPAYVNDNSHWWDGSQIYGSTSAVPGDAADGHEGQGQGRRRLPARPGPDHGARSHRHDRERVGGAQPAARPLCPGAQRGLRSAGAGIPGLGRSAALRQGTARSSAP